MPGQGVASVFGYGEAYGAIKGICAAFRMPITEVHPRTWKKVMMPDMDKSSKDAARYRAMQLWPGTGYFDRKKDQHIAEAALIAKYGWDQTATAKQGGEGGVDPK
jgi:crossover junction endodeoxyribonuclease RuvC